VAACLGWAATAVSAIGVLSLQGLCGVKAWGSWLQMARSKKACLIFFDEIDAIGGARFDDGAGVYDSCHPRLGHGTEPQQCVPVIELEEWALAQSLLLCMCPFRR
jgi:hypothetical protein